MANGRYVKKRPTRPVDVIKNVVSDIAHGLGELKRQSGTAVARVKEGVRRVKKFMR